ncbi:MAG: fatty acid desaturase [Planctomycetia bacterium]|nr:fatty acid desaturase [Planctomycetia bacterium]
MSSVSSPLDLRELVKKWHRNDGGNHIVHPLSTFSHIGCMIGAVYTWNAGLWPLTIVFWALCAHIGHSKLIAFHEASHGTLNPRWRINEAQGILLGTTILVPLSVYRFVHGQHHAYIGTENDLELWPFVNTNVSRSMRILAAIGELVFGFFYTPITFLHGVLVARRIPPAQLRRIIWEYALCFVTWGIVLTTINLNGWWEGFFVGYFVQALIAGNLQSIRKFTEHVGLFGSTILTTTRTVVDEHPVGDAISASMLRIDYHGTHHRYAKVPYYYLPEATPHVYDGQTPHEPLFPTYWHAVWDMFRSLGDPRVGAQWTRPIGTPSPKIGVKKKDAVPVS